MTTKWPVVSGKYSRKITIFHAQAKYGNPDLHPHDFTVTFGWKHEINPYHGCTWSVYETADKVQRLCALVDGKNLNDLMTLQPTAENMACWLLVRTPSFYDWIEVACYDGYTVRVDRGGISKHWQAEYLGGAAPEGLTA